MLTYYKDIKDDGIYELSNTLLSYEIGYMLCFQLKAAFCLFSLNFNHLKIAILIIFNDG